MKIIDFLIPKKLTYYIDYDSSIRQALEKFAYHRYSAVPVINGFGEYCFTLSQGDILNFIKDNDFNKNKAEKGLIKDIDRYRSYAPIKIDASLDSVYELILQQNFIPVVDDRHIFIGIIKRKDVLNYILNNK